MTGPEIVLPFLLSAVASYLIGSVSFSIIFTRLFAEKDVRDSGSGNAGTTNVLRTAGKLPAVLTFAGDFIKCVAAVRFSIFVFNIFGGKFDPLLVSFVAGIFCMLGHALPIFFGFRGGKGVVVTAALLLLIDWRLFLIAFVVFAVVFFFSHIVSLSTVIGVFTLPLGTYIISSVFHPQSMPWLNTLFAVLIMCVILFLHRSNIRRLCNGTESRIWTSHKPKGGE